MQNSLLSFNFEGHSLEMFGTFETPEWVTEDVCKVLDILDHRKTHKRLKPYQKGRGLVVPTPGGKQLRATVTEAGLYSLIFKSRKEVGERFREWVFTEVLPSIRKTGGYTAPDQAPWVGRMLPSVGDDSAPKTATTLLQELIPGKHTAGNRLQFAQKLLYGYWLMRGHGPERIDGTPIYQSSDRQLAEQTLNLMALQYAPLHVPDDVVLQPCPKVVF